MDTNNSAIAAFIDAQRALPARTQNLQAINDQQKPWCTIVGSTTRSAPFRIYPIGISPDSQAHRQKDDHPQYIRTPRHKMPPAEPPWLGLQIRADVHPASLERLPQRLRVLLVLARDEHGVRLRPPRAKKAHPEVEWAEPPVGQPLDVVRPEVAVREHPLSQRRQDRALRRIEFHAVFGIFFVEFEGVLQAVGHERLIVLPACEAQPGFVIGGNMYPWGRQLPDGLHDRRYNIICVLIRQSALSALHHLLHRLPREALHHQQPVVPSILNDAVPYWKRNSTRGVMCIEVVHPVELVLQPP
ncbi:hypothetical protein BJ138DRAFT_1120265 [Hygrophoropsis aurantiaca]|uniref:Uncharacterized protein n=1 Tax=Hygrophoropsis aurantiaca TaxID=72124 RepID=A0ACB7ZQR1_9AGAM|nr:hypothetical protein BJ138DRAFT_1120265 [Hygrophoropsis aurantiaca]